MGDAAIDLTATTNAAFFGSSGDLLADRRFQWAIASSAAGDTAGAADLLRQTLEIAPKWAAAWLALGENLLAAGETQAAIQAYQTCAALDPTSRLGAPLRLAVAGAQTAPMAAPTDYVRALFDQYAANFDTHLVEALQYRGPQILSDAVRRACARLSQPFAFAHGVDLGCGTGLMGTHLRGVVATLDGVDLSPVMLAAARKSGVYGSLHAGDIVDFLASYPEASLDLVIAADVFVYIGDLQPVFAAAARACATGGCFAFTSQRSDLAPWKLGDDLRYSHHESHLRELGCAHGFAVTLIEPQSTRREAGADVPGLVCCLARR